MVNANPAIFMFDLKSPIPLSKMDGKVSTSWRSVRSAFSLSEDAGYAETDGKKFFIMLIGGDEAPTTVDEISKSILDVGFSCKVEKCLPIEGTGLVKVIYSIESKIEFDSYDIDSSLRISNVKSSELEGNLTMREVNKVKLMISGVTRSPLGDGEISEIIWNSESPSDQLDILGEYFITDQESRLLFLTANDASEKISLVRNAIELAITGLEADLSSGSGPKEEVKDLKDRIYRLDAPDEITDALKKQFKRFKAFSEGSAEYGSALNYMETVLDIPWGKYSYKDSELKVVMNMLDKSHYGLGDVKDYIVEYIAVEKITGRSAGNVLCFIGEPGCGKTSFAKQIARATSREVIKIAVGGMSDESEFRGHRRTYIAAMPGRIINGLIKAKTLDPLFIIDEVDKIGIGRGNPTAALLEILDPEQNSEFVDRFIGLPVDLSRASFICTANYKEQIPPALLDRMEVVNFRSYNEEERFHILSEYIIPKTLKDYCLDTRNVSFSIEVIDYITKTEKIRKIELIIRKLLRKACVTLLIENPDSMIIDMEYAKEVLNLKTTIMSKSMGFN